MQIDLTNRFPIDKRCNINVQATTPFYAESLAVDPEMLSYFTVDEVIVGKKVIFSACDEAQTPKSDRLNLPRTLVPVNTFVTVLVTNHDKEPRQFRGMIFGSAA
jgi:hypothetical protein